MSEKYFLPENYVENTVNITLDEVSGLEYWNSRRILKSKFYQYSIYTSLSKFISRNKSTKIVDIGCGPGTKLKVLHKKYPHLNIFGIDQKSAINYCNHNYDFGTWIVDDIESPSSIERLKDAEIVVSCDVIEHLLNPNSLLSYIKTISTEDTIIVFSTPDRDIIRGKKCLSSPNPVHIREWNSHEFKRYLEHNGFIVETQELHLPVKFGLNQIFFSEVIKPIFKGKNPCYNQFVVCKLSKSI